MIVQIYKEPFCKRHYISVLSFTFIFRVFGYAACVFLAAIVCHAAGDTWMKQKTSSGRPDVHFQYNGLAHFSDATSTAPPVVCTTDTATNQLLGTRMGVCSLQVFPQDLDLDGKQDRIRVEFGIVNMQRVTSVALLLEFHYRLQAAATIDLNGLVHVEHSSPGPGSELYTSGSLQLCQGALLTAGTSYADTEHVLLRHNTTDPYELGSQTQLDVSKLLSKDSGRDMSLAFKPSSQTWKAGVGPFKAIIDIAVPPAQSLNYRPRALSEVKFGFIQWLALFALFAYMFSVFEASLFHVRTFDTFCTSDLVEKSKPRF